MAADVGTFKGIFFYFRLVVQGWGLYNIRIIKDRRASNDRKSKTGLTSGKTDSRFVSWEYSDYYTSKELTYVLDTLSNGLVDSIVKKAPKFHK